MQNLDPTLCTEDPMIVTDKRDEQFYTIREIAGTCWMIDNLRLGYNENNPDITTFILTPEDSNVTEERTINAYDMTTHNETDKECYGTYSVESVSGIGAGYENPCVHSRENTNNLVGVWYNYVLATAGTVDNSASSGITENATESICPKGWTLPNLTQIRAIGPNTDTYVEAFAPAEGGFYRYGATTSMTERGYFWSATAYNTYETYTLRYNDGGNGRLAITNGMRRSDALYIRCVLDES